MKQYYKIIITLLLFLFSLYYTNKGIKLLKMKDPLMQEIITKTSLYNIMPKEAIITNTTIIPGTKGQIVNTLKSYDKMKKLGVFNENLLVYDLVLPKENYQNIYDKIIVMNYDNNQISLVFNINNIEVYKEIKNILENYNLKGNYYFTNTFFTNNKEEIIKITDPILVNNLYNLKDYTNYIDYCLVYETNDNPCKNRKHTILANINIDTYHFTYTKNNLHNGNIIAYTFHKNNIKDLNLILNYLLNYKYEILTIDELLQN